MQRSLFVLGILIHAIGNILQGLAPVCCGEIAEGDTVTQGQTISNGMVYFKKYIVGLWCLNHLHTTKRVAAQQVVRMYEIILQIFLQFPLRHRLLLDGNHHIRVGVLHG